MQQTKNSKDAWEMSLGFPGGFVVKNLPVNAGDLGPGRSHLLWRNQARAPQTLSLLRSRAWEPQLLSPHAATAEARVPKACALQQEKLPCLFNLYADYIMRNAGLEEAQAGVKIVGRNINNLRYADDTTLMAESEEELKNLLMKVKEEGEKVGLKLNIQKT